VKNKHQTGTVARLISSTEPAPENLPVVLKELGKGDHRFSGTSFGRGECDLPTFLQECRDHETGLKIPAGKVQQSIYWLTGDDGQVIGIVRCGTASPLNR
jgi:predicted acetyltransferase